MSKDVILKTELQKKRRNCSVENQQKVKGDT